MFPWAGCALTAPFHPYHRRLPHINAHFPASGKARPICAISSFPSNPLALGFDGSPFGAWRYLSVALVLGLPPAGVTRYPCPVEPGLSSSGSFRFPSAAVRPGRGFIVLHGEEKVKCLANSFPKGYTIKGISVLLSKYINWNLAARFGKRAVRRLAPRVYEGGGKSSAHW